MSAPVCSAEKRSEEPSDHYAIMRSKALSTTFASIDLSPSPDASPPEEFLALTISEADPSSLYTTESSWTFSQNLYASEATITGTLMDWVCE